MTNTPRIRGLEALRGLACVMVITSHIPAYLVLPPLLHEVLAVPLFGIGVDLFFVISGFVTAQSFSSHKTLNSVEATLAFWQRRIIRLLPLLAIVVMAYETPQSMLTPLWSVERKCNSILWCPLLAWLCRSMMRIAVILVLVAFSLKAKPPPVLDIPASRTNFTVTRPW
jgi:peptidoglycan/LPS O-acetylase OafA/YrhL